MEASGKKQFNTIPGIFIIAYHAFILLSLPFYFAYATLHWQTFVAAVVLLYLTGLSITGGYHRFYSHRSYKTNPVIEAILLFFGAMALQGSALRWSFDHRIHHAHVDTDKDPYSIKKGFWYAHMMWLFEKPNEIDAKIVPDLLKNKKVMFQHNRILSCMIITNVIAFLAVGWLIGDWAGAFFIAVWLRIFALHHFTWFINSLAHTWGDKPFSEEHSAVDNYIISMLTFGEGYHNYHHTFANDYRNGTRWFHFDPTKWLIWTLSKLGLAHSLKKTDLFTIKKRMVLERKVLLMDQIKLIWDEKKEALEAEVHQLSERIVNKISEINKLRDKYFQFKHDCASKEILKELRQEIRFMKKSIKADWKHWSNLSWHVRRTSLAYCSGQ